MSNVKRLPIRKLLTNVAEPQSPEERDEAWNEIERRAAERDALVAERDRYREALRRELAKQFRHAHVFAEPSQRQLDRLVEKALAEGVS